MKQFKNTKALLLVVGIVLLMAACTAAWQRGRNAEQATAQATNTTKSLLDGSRKTGKNDSLQLKDIIFPKSSSINDLDRIYYFDTSKSNKVLHFERTEIFFETYRHFFAIPDDFTFQYVIPKDEWSKKNDLNIHYKIYYKKILTYAAARVELFENNNSVRSVHLSFPFSPSEDFDIQPTITEPQAFELMLKACYPARYVWEEEYQEPVKKLWKKDSTFRFEPPKGKLIINGTKLQYHYYVITCHNYIEAWNVFIDAKTGEAKVYDNAQHCHEVCDMGTSYSSVTLPTLHDYGNASLSLNSCSVNNCTYIHYKQASPYVDVNYLYKLNPTATETIADATYLSSGNCVPATVNVSATTATITDQGQTTTFDNLEIGQIHLLTTSTCGQSIPVAIGHSNGPVVNDIQVVEVEESSGTSSKCYFDDIHITMNLQTDGIYTLKILPYPLSATYNIGSEHLVAGTTSTYSVNKIIGDLFIREGNYAILITKNPIGTSTELATTTGINLRIQPNSNASYLQEQTTTALWAFNRAYNFFGSGNNIINLSGQNATAINLPSATNPFNAYLNTNPSNQDEIFKIDLGNKQNYYNVEDEVEPNLYQHKEGIALDVINDWITLDAVAHEYVHGIDEHTSTPLNPYTENGSQTWSIEEAICDIFGVLIEATQKEIDWSLGNEISGFNQRNFANPQQNNRPDTYEGQYWMDTGEPSIVAYNNSTVISHWFYLLVNGGNGQNDKECNYNFSAMPTVNNIAGLEIAAKIVYDMLLNSLLHDVDFPNFREAAKNSAKKIAQQVDPEYGEDLDAYECHPIVIQTANALKAVNLELANYDCSSYQHCCLPTDPDNTTCDNHLPYISSLKITDSTNPNTIYSHQAWQIDGEQLCLNNISEMQTTDFNTPLQVEVTTSEPLSELRFKGFSFNDYTLDANINIPILPNTTTYNFTIPIPNSASNIPSLAHLNFSGMDLAGNRIEALQTYPATATANCVNSADIPTRNTDGQWTPPPHDAENDKSFSLQTDHCSFDFSVHDENYIGALYCDNPVGVGFYSYSIKDNATGEWVVRDYPITNPSASFFTTTGILPYNYTLEVTAKNGCVKSISGTWEEPPGCVYRLPSNDINAHIFIDAVNCYSLGGGLYSISLDVNNSLPVANFTTISISTASNSGPSSMGSYVCCDAYMVTIYEEDLNAELPFLITTSGDYACKYYGTISCNGNIDPGPPVGNGNCNGPYFVYDPNVEALPQIETCSQSQICLPYHLSGADNIAVTLATSLPYPVHQTVINEQEGMFCFTPDDNFIGTHTLKLIATNPFCPYSWNIVESNFNVSIRCCPTTFSTTATTPAYTACNGQTLLGGSATLQSDATCLTNFSITNGIDHTAYGLLPGDNTLTLTADGSTYTTTVNIPSISIDEQNIQATATINPTDHNCTADYCSGSISLDARLQIDENNYNTNNSYTWSDCPNCNTATRTDLCTGSYTVTVTNLAAACSRAFTYNISLADAISYQNQYDEILCCIAEQPEALLPNNSAITYPDPLYPNRPALLVTGTQQWTSQSNPLALSNELYLATDIVIAPGAQLTITGMQLYFAPHCRILVQAGGRMTATNSQFDGGCQTMWQGIQAEGSTATQVPAQVFLQQCTVSNAIVGLAGMNIPLVDSNHILTLNTPDTNPYSNISSFALPQLWHTNSRQTAGAQLQTTETLFRNCLQGINISWVGNNANDIHDCIFDSEEIRYPFTQLATQTEAGIYALWVKAAGSLHHNRFNNLRYGMRLNEVNRIDTHNNQLNDNLCGISSRAWLMGINHINRFRDNTFQNNRIALQADGIDNLLVSNNIINPNTNAQTTYPNGSAGFYLRGCNSLVQNNHISRTRFGLILADSELDGTEIGGNIIEQTMEAIVCEGNNSSCYLTCNHLLDYTKFGLDLRAAGNAIGKLPPQGDCTNQQPAANTFVPLNAIDIMMGSNTADLYYNDLAANTYLVATAPGSLTGQFIPQSSNCSAVNIVDYCEDLHLTSLADIDLMPNSIARDHELTKWFLTYLRNEDYESALTLVHKYNNELMLRKLVPHKIDKDSLVYAESLLNSLDTESEEQLRYRQLYQLVIDVQKEGRTPFELNPTEIALLSDIAGSPAKTAYKAQTLLYAYNGTEYPVNLPIVASGDIANNWITLFKNSDNISQIRPLFPNPCSSESWLAYQISDNNTAIFELYDLTGHLLAQQKLTGEGTYRLSTANYPNGMYLYRISMNGQTLYQNKWVITK